MTDFHQRQIILTLTAPAARGIAPSCLVQPNGQPAPHPATETFFGFPVYYSPFTKKMQQAFFVFVPIPVGGGIPPNCCIAMGSNPLFLQKKIANTIWCSLFSVCSDLNRCQSFFPYLFRNSDRFKRSHKCCYRHNSNYRQPYLIIFHVQSMVK